MRLILRDGEQVDFAKHAVVVRNEFHAIQRRPIIEPPGKLIVADDLYADRLILCPQVTSVDRWSTEIVSSRGSIRLNREACIRNKFEVVVESSVTIQRRQQLGPGIGAINVTNVRQHSSSSHRAYTRGRIGASQRSFEQFLVFNCRDGLLPNIQPDKIKLGAGRSRQCFARPRALLQPILLEVEAFISFELES